MSESSQLKPCYLITGDDESKISIAVARLRKRGEEEGGSVERFVAPGGRKGPDVQELAAALAAIPLATGHRYLIVEGAESWLKADHEVVCESLETLPPETTVAIIARGKTPKALAGPVEKAGGEILEFAAPSERELPGQVVQWAAGMGLELTIDAGRLLVQRMGPRPVRLKNELERLSLWAGGEQVEIDVEDLEAMVADETELAIWSLGDALAEGDIATATAAADRLLAQGEPIQKVIATVAPRVRGAYAAAEALEQGTPPAKVAAGLGMHPYAARQLVAKVNGRDPAELARAVEAVADLEVNSRGGAVSDELALTLAIRRACGAVSMPARPAALAG